MPLLQCTTALLRCYFDACSTHVALRSLLHVLVFMKQARVYDLPLSEPAKLQGMLSLPSNILGNALSSFQYYKGVPSFP